MNAVINQLKNSNRLYNIVGYEGGNSIEILGIPLDEILCDGDELFYSLLEECGVDSLLSLNI